MCDEEEPDFSCSKDGKGDHPSLKIIDRGKHLFLLVFSAALKIMMGASLSIRVIELIPDLTLFSHQTGVSLHVFQPFQ